MNKFLKGSIAASLGGIMIFAAACTPETPPPNGEKKWNTETRQLQLSTSALDGNFNPFFYTSGNDGNILSHTQIGMLTMNESGAIVYGEDEACVTLDYKSTPMDAAGNPITSGTMDDFTEYEFIIKKGIKFSDGVELTIKDVLFSLYVYLDSAYTGSATIYSTDIVGLTKYRTQSADADSDSALESGFTAKAMERINAIISWADDAPTNEKEPTDTTVKADFNTVKNLFKEEIESDWTTVKADFPESYNKSYRFTEAWQAYLFNEGIIKTQTQKSATSGYDVEIYDDTNNNGIKEDGELYYTTLDKPYGTENEPEAQYIIDGIAEATSEAEISKYLSTHTGATREFAISQLQQDYCVNLVYTAITERSNFTSTSATNPLVYWATASNALQEFAGDERTKHFDEVKQQNGGELLYTSIEGITTCTRSTDFSGKSLGSEHDVLKIKINGIDPKAQFNFAFTVSPLHIYSGEYTDNLGKHHDYVAEAMRGENFGVATGDSTFFNTVLKTPEKNGVPVGAGPYKASNINGTEDTDRSSFYSNGIVYFMRNDNFKTVGTGIENAKIKYVNYKELTDDRIMEALGNQAIDYGMPNATATNSNSVANYNFLKKQDYDTGGYGYVGVNPKFIPEYKVRQAIMKALDTSMTADYYEGLASVIHRPMSTTSWAYPKDVPAYKDVAYTTIDAEITKLVEDSGYVKENGIYVKRKPVDGMTNAPIGKKLEFPFTIAGATTDHPAKEMFRIAAERLNGLGFKIIVKSGASALKDMISGNLEVWAAAWSSASDPDPYQVYHKESKATSVNNWNYPDILQDTQKWSYEYDVIDRLSTKIEEGRQTLVEDVRKSVYAECLDLIMELAVELPTYQRRDLCVYNVNVIDESSLVKEPSHYVGLFDKIWEIDYV